MADALSNLLPGGVNSPVRSFSSAGMASSPVLIKKGEGAFLHTTEGKELIDYVHGWGSIIHGHARQKVREAIIEQLASGLGFGLTTEIEGEFAALLAQKCKLAMSRAVNSGTEATMTAIRLARGYTGRDFFIKFAGCYHGHSDALLVSAGSGSLTFGQPSSAGVPKQAVANTLVLPYNDVDALVDCFSRNGDKLAAAIVEPIAGNMNLVVPSNEFITTLAQLCEKYGAVLIADEVMTGLRATYGLAIRDVFGVEPGLACLGKVIGGGLPVAAVAGDASIMAKLAPTGPVYQAGTLSGNPVCLAAGIATMRLLDKKAYSFIDAAAGNLVKLMQEEAQAQGVEFCAQHVGGMFGYYLLSSLPTCLAEVEQVDQDDFECFYQAMLGAGVLLPPSRFEACFLGLGHNEEVLERTRIAAREAFATLAMQKRKAQKPKKKR